jgi:DNA (cytosine-5)-methyltransferase 1
MFSFADLCAGIGGFRLGLERAGWKCVFSCDSDKHCAVTYEDNFGAPFDALNILDVRAADLSGVEAICCGFPCQPFSIAGKRRGFDDERGAILPKLLSLVSDVLPSIVLLENVPNFATHDGGRTLGYLVDTLSSLRYDVHFEVLNSAFFGVPQSRPRLYVIAIAPRMSGLLLNITKKRTPPEPFRAYLQSGDFSIPISDRWQEYIDLYTAKKQLSQMTFQVPKTRVSVERVNKGANLEDCVLQLRSSGIRACSIDAPLPTFAVSHSGGGAMIPVYTGERRHLSLSEMKSLMGFPSSFRFPVARTHAIKQLANTVCPAVITSLAQDIEFGLGRGRQSHVA